MDAFVEQGADLNLRVGSVACDAQSRPYFVATHYERGEDVAVNGTVTFVLDETREYLDPKGRIKPVPDGTNPGRLKWICVANPEAIPFFDKFPAPYVLVHGS